MQHVTKNLKSVSFEFNDQLPVAVNLIDQHCHVSDL